MTGRVAGKVALITGAGRGQGRNHAIRLAQEGADIIAIDVPGQYEGLDYAMATAQDLGITRDLVEAEDRRCLIVEADVREAATLTAVVAQAVAEFDRLDIVVANAAVCAMHSWDQVTPELWHQIIDTNLFGVWNTITASAPHLISSGGGSIICIGSTSALKGTPFLGPYTAAKHGVVGIAQVMANELARHWIRVNTVHPAGVKTALVGALGHLDELLAENPELGPIYSNMLPTQWVEKDDISNAVIYLASDESRFVTGTDLKVDAGNTNR